MPEAEAKQSYSWIIRRQSGFSVVCATFASCCASLYNKPINQLSSESKVKADMLNDFFSTVFTREDEKDTPVLNPVSDAKVVDIDVNVDIIRKKLSNLNDDKAAGNDNLSPSLLKAVADEIAYPANR